MEDVVSAPRLFGGRKKRSAEQIRRAEVCGKRYMEAAYRPQFALGIVCRDEADQQRLFQRVSKLARGRDVKVLVI